jgi:glycerophosphoryl diester phosphodiesterase
MVELDVRRARDGVPVLFHGYGGAGMMLVDCGIMERIDHFTSAELREIRYRGTDQSVLTLDEALGLCVDLGLGVMLDVKSEVPQPDYLHETRNQVARHGLENSVMTLAQHQAILDLLPSQTLWPIRQRTLAAALTDATHPLKNQYWFDDPDSITDEEMMQLQARGVLTIGCINSFRYPAHSFAHLEGQDIARLLRLEVDGYQIDSCYGHFFEKLTASAATVTQ